ncbi:MAG TPA: hypothetical protein VGK24_01145 [Candidatus Angelobacter sp.]|jgi:hypothetical protein
MEKQLVLDYLLKLKTAHLGSCTVRPEQDSDGWEILDSDGNHKGKVTLANAFISGTDAMLPLQVETGDNLQMFIVTMHLEEDEWRIDDFGEWEKSDLGLAKLLHQPTAMEKNEAAAQQTLGVMTNAIRFYVNVHPRIGFPADLRDVVRSQNSRNGWGLLLDESFAADPLIKDGYRFRYLRTAIGSGNQDYGSFEITAMPVEFGSTGSKSYFVNESGLVHATSENRPATEDDPRPDD